MNPEQLLQTLRDSGLDDKAIKALLSETLATLEPQQKPDEKEGMTEEEEKAKAGELLGVTF